VDESSYRDVPLRLRVPPPSSQKPIEASVPNLHAPCFKLNEALIWPVRSLLPPHEVAGELGVELEELHRTKQMSSISFISFEELGVSSRDEKEKLMNYLVHHEDDALSQTRLKELKTALTQAIEQLPEKERLVISLYHLDELTMKETGEVLNITESRVSQIHSQAIMRLRNRLRKERLLEDID
jgi:DNA-directed RNA polymerase sigma subunit (sigma70/sigma32)